MAGTTPATGSYKVYSLNQALVLLSGSFQGNGGSTPTVTRGGDYTIARIATGQYRVTLSFPPNAALMGNTTGTGILVEPHGWCTSESETPGTAPVKQLHVQCSRVTTAGAFDIFAYDIVGAAAYDLTSADRISWQLCWKNTSFSP